MIFIIPFFVLAGGPILRRLRTRWDGVEQRGNADNVVQSWDAHA